ncbi:hypothetical protein [Paenibacillus sp. 1P07SE]|uniref:hypothetical protein n=1 Tax=Paenibacillus sp. 1P07SE TaxID=3132209 RepID=UPI0039A748FA
MYLGYRFIEKGGRYHRGDPLESVEAIHVYVQQYKKDFPEIRITDHNSSDILVHVLEGRIDFPKQWALMEIQREFLVEADMFNAVGFADAMRRSGFECDPPRTPIEAEMILGECYRSLPQE